MRQIRRANPALQAGEMYCSLDVSPFEAEDSSARALNLFKTKLGVLAVAICLLTLWLYLPTLRNGFVDWDDYAYLNEAARHSNFSARTLRWAFTSTRPLYYQPLTWLSHVADVRLWDANPAGHHLTSIILHAINAALAAGLIWSLSQFIPNLSKGERISLAATVALVFGIHPLQVESVAWVAERKNLLCGLFSLACLCCYVRGVSRGVIALFVAALLSKPMAISLPGVMLALDFFPLRKNEKSSWWQLIREKIPLILMSAVISIMTMLSLAHEGGVTELGRLGVFKRIAVAARGLIFYLWKLLWPSWLSPYYPLESAVSLREPEFVASAVAVVAISSVVIWNRNRAPALLAAWIAYVALILPVSGLMQNGAQAAGDRFMYLAMLAPLTLIVSGLIVMLRRLHVIGRVALASLLICELAFFGYMTRSQIAVWRNDVTLWTEALEHYPDSALANYMMANCLGLQKCYEEALPFAKKAVALSPEFARAYYRLATLWSRLGQTQQALEALRHAVVRDPVYARKAQEDDDLGNLRDDPHLNSQFRQLVAL